MPTRAFRLALVGLAAGCAVVVLGDRLPPIHVRGLLRSILRIDGVEYPIAGLVVLVLVPAAAFPAEPIANGVVVNLYTHLLGYCFGFIAPYATLVVLEGRAMSEPAGPERAASDRSSG